MLRVLDIETSGLDASQDTIIEIASIDMLRGGGFANLQQSYVAQPRPIPPEASGIHHILDADVKGAPQLREVIDKFDGADAYIAHGSRLEQAFLEPVFGQKTWICTWRCAMRAWPKLKSYSLHAIRYSLGLLDCLGVERKRIAPQRATSDCIVTGAVFEALLKVEDVKYGDLVRWSQEPALLPFFEFGPHRGVPLSGVPKDYLIQVTCSTNVDADMRFTASSELARRKEAA